MAQAAHAAQLGWRTLLPPRPRALAGAGFPLAVRDATPPQWQAARRRRRARRPRRRVHRGRARHGDGAVHRRLNELGAVSKRLVELDGAVGDGVPAELVHGALAAGQAHRGGPHRVGAQLVDGVRPGRPRTPRSGTAWYGHEQAGQPVGDDLGDAADRAGDDRRLAGHRLEVDDAQRLVDRRADEHGGVREQLGQLVARQHLAHPHDARARLAPAARPPPRSRPRSRGCPARRRTARAAPRGRTCSAARSRCASALLPGDPPDEDRRRAVGVDAVARQHVVVVRRRVQRGVDAVVDHVHLGRVDERVGVEDVGAHAVGHGDDRVGGLVGLPLGPGRDAVAAAELLGLPRPLRLERVRASARAGRRAAARRARRPGWRTRCASAARRRRPTAAAISRSTPRVRSALLASASPGGVRVGVHARPRPAAAPKQCTSTSTSRRSSRTRNSTCTPAPP